MFVDTGSSPSLVSWTFINNAELTEQVKPCNVKINSFTKDSVPVMGTITINLTIAGNSCNHEFVVSNLLQDEFLIGIDYMRVYEE
jgi:hypothetical protein